MSPDRHRRLPISFRPADDDYGWLEAYAKETGKPVRRILAEALSEYRTKHDPGALQVAQHQTGDQG